MHPFTKTRLGGGIYILTHTLDMNHRFTDTILSTCSGSYSREVNAQGNAAFKTDPLSIVSPQSEDPLTSLPLNILNGLLARTSDKASRIREELQCVILREGVWGQFLC